MRNGAPRMYDKASIECIDYYAMCYDSIDPGNKYTKMQKMAKLLDVTSQWLMNQQKRFDWEQVNFKAIPEPGDPIAQYLVQKRYPRNADYAFVVIKTNDGAYYDFTGRRIAVYEAPEQLAAKKQRTQDDIQAVAIATSVSALMIQQSINSALRK